MSKTLLKRITAETHLRERQFLQVT